MGVSTNRKSRAAVIQPNDPERDVPARAHIDREIDRHRLPEPATHGCQQSLPVHPTRPATLDATVWRRPLRLRAGQLRVRASASDTNRAATAMGRPVAAQTLRNTGLDLQEVPLAGSSRYRRNGGSCRPSARVTPHQRSECDGIRLRRLLSARGVRRRATTVQPNRRGVIAVAGLSARAARQGSRPTRP